MIDTALFYKLADEYLEKLAEMIEEKYIDCDCDYLQGILAISSPKGDYVINKQTPNRQIWYSSPVSGVARFNYQDDDWIKNGSDITLAESLEKDLNS